MPTAITTRQNPTPTGWCCAECDCVLRQKPDGTFSLCECCEDYEVLAEAEFHGHKLEDIPVLNPGDWFGKTWLLEIGGSYTPLFLIVEADTIQGAIDELSGHEKYGHNIVIPEEGYGDYGLHCHPGDNVGGKDIAVECWRNLKGEVVKEEMPEPHYNDGGVPCDLDHLMIHGAEGHGVDMPFPCRYFADDLPGEGMLPLSYGYRNDQED